ncbi:MAG: UDP-N-acetylmuramate--L-alanine ligase [Endomicrobiaceae bacterium]|nr:UDP-N-acetylmuramate--L-alanine ligase [Endomicrobiaceae bacterium]
MFNRKQKIHFVGIGGSGMSGIAEVLLNLGHIVSGSDIKKTDVTQRLKQLGAKIYIGHNAKNVKKVDVVVTSTAIPKDNPEVLQAVKNKIIIIPRVEMLIELARLKYTITIAGTHGKTTTTSMTSMVLSKLDPTIVIGGKLKHLKSGAKLGKGEYLIAEADESDGSFLKLSPVTTVVTNIDNDHLDYYGNMDNLKDAFVRHMNSVPFYGCAIICTDSPLIREVLPKLTRKYITYGLTGKPDLNAKNIKVVKGNTEFQVIYKGKKLGKIVLKVPGRHNILNALASISVGLQYNISFANIKEALNNYGGVGRRIEIKGELNDITVIDDYGHHPTEIEATLSAIKHNWKNRRLVVIFQPHRYTRTLNLYKEFGKSLTKANVVYVMDIYPASEKPIKGVTSDLIIKSAVENKCNVFKFKNIKAVAAALKKGDILLTIGAGNVWQKGEELLTLI